MLGYATNLLAKELRFESDIASVYSGKAQQLLDDAPYEGCAFPLVRNIIFDFAIDDGISEYGEDWDRIGEELGVLLRRTQHSWIRLVNVGDRSGWTVDETRQFQRLFDSGVKPPTRQRDAALSGSFWAAADDETLLKMVDGSAMNTAAKWEQAGKALGRSAIACKWQFAVVNHSRKHIQATVDSQSLVTSEVQRQRESSSDVDWLQVCQATGLGMRKRLELSQYDVGKASWHYDPDSFSQSMADCIAGFIKEHYLASIPVNYRAVSNFMWVTMEDCVRIHDML
ncbi:hypothetical protein GGH93_006067 [Coemansia aciculifera]|nr:hypothetical protein GGH93_006067 [Coemansia aciculifera]